MSFLLQSPLEYQNPHFYHNPVAFCFHLLSLDLYCSEGYKKFSIRCGFHKDKAITGPRATTQFKIYNELVHPLTLGRDENDIYLTLYS